MLFLKQVALYYVHTECIDGAARQPRFGADLIGIKDGNNCLFRTADSKALMPNDGDVSRLTKKKKRVCHISVVYCNG